MAVPDFWKAWPVYADGTDVVPTLHALWELEVIQMET